MNLDHKQWLRDHVLLGPTKWLLDEFKFSEEEHKLGYFRKIAYYRLKETTEFSDFRSLAYSLDIRQENRDRKKKLVRLRRWLGRLFGC